MHAAETTPRVLSAMKAVCEDGAVEPFYRFGILEKGSAYLFNLVHILADNIGDVACVEGVEAMLLAMRVCPDALHVQEDGCAVLATVAEYGALHLSHTLLFLRPSLSPVSCSASLSPPPPLSATAAFSQSLPRAQTRCAGKQS